MGRVWRQQAGTLLIIFMVLAVVTMVYGVSRNAGPTIPGMLMWLALYSLLAWRIWRRRSSGARDTLLFFSALGMLLLIRAVFRWSPDPLVAGGLAIAQFVLLLSPAIRAHVRAKPLGSRPSDG